MGLFLEAELGRALERGEFCLHYQPTVHLQTGRVIAQEALVRWQHPDLGMILPGRFITMAEESGRILLIGDWVLRTACAQNKEWQDQRLAQLPVAVNLSPIQLGQRDFVSKVEKILSDTGLAPRYLQLQLTPAANIPDLDLAAHIMSRLKDMGVQLAVDGFGTGYSSVGFLRRFSFGLLNIDRSYVRNVTGSHQGGAIVRSIVGLGHSLDLKVIAEGVETTEQLARLRAYACDQMQGHLFSRALPAKELAGLLQEGRSLPAAPGA